MIGFILWYASGIAATSLFVWHTNHQCKRNLTYGDVFFAALHGLGGAITVAAMFLLAIIAGIARIFENKFWAKPVFAKSEWKDGLN